MKKLIFIGAFALLFSITGFAQGNVPTLEVSSAKTTASSTVKNAPTLETTSSNSTVTPPAEEPKLQSKEVLTKKPKPAPLTTPKSVVPKVEATEKKSASKKK